MATSHKKKNDIFSKKVPSNPRYQNVKTKLDTGASASNYLNKIEEIRKNYRYRKDEIFKRMKVSTFSQLVLQVAEVCNLELDRLDMDTANSVIEDECLSEKENGSISERRLLQQVVCGVGEIEIENEQNLPLDVNMSESKEEKLSMKIPELASLPYLLLDIREKDDYDECHIIGSLNYPGTMLSRSVNYLSKEILLFKNKPGKIIIVYDIDEKLCPNIATGLVQRQIDNVIMLSGGMKVLHKKFPSCFISGKIPPACFSPILDRKGKPKPPPNIVENEGIEWYTTELLEKIQDTLDDVLLSSESSRLSSRTTARSSQTGRASNMSTSSRASTTSQATWR